MVDKGTCPMMDCVAPVPALQSRLDLYSGYRLQSVRTVVAPSRRTSVAMLNVLATVLSLVAVPVSGGIVPIVSDAVTVRIPCPTSHLSHTTMQLICPQ